VNGGIRIGDWAVDPETNELRRGDEAVRVEPKAMEVLMLLAGHVGRVVTREQIFAAVWPKVVVGDEALTQSVIKLRRALGDDSRAPAYIQTISKRGYRLIAPVMRGDGAMPPPPATRVPNADRWRRGVGVIGALLVIVGALGVYLSSRPMDGAQGDDAQARGVPEGAWTTVAIVPFEALPSSSDDTYLARGIGDDLSTDLSRLPGMRVVRAPAAPAASGARYSVSGTVQRDGATLRINVFLADTATHEQLWAGRFERPYRDLFSVQDEITRHVVEVLPAKVGETERRRAARRYTQSLAAYDAFQRAQALFLLRTSEDNEEARALYRKAIELDPKFARAYASLAMTYAMDYRLAMPAESSRSLERAFDLAETARIMDPGIPQVYWALGFVHAQGRRHAQAREALQHAIALDASFADAYALLAGIQTYTGHPAESIPLLRAAMRLNPGGGYLYYLLLGRAYLFEGDIEQALINLREAALRNPVDVETRVFLAAALVAAGSLDAARWEADEIRALQPAFSGREWLDTYPMTSIPQRERLTALLDAVHL
jgi:DNA-binding winged helix-turn-helix (wHTH) protein/TolB-like protein/Flp pilus assembly protein TadD